MLPFRFYYNDQWYWGSYVISGAEAHGFYWCFLESDELTHSFGQCMIFSFSNGTLMPAKSYDSEHESLVESIREAILPLYEQRIGAVRQDSEGGDPPRPNTP
jgi:hypothetical protein